MADLPDWLRIPDSFALSGDPVDGNPFPEGEDRHRVWRDATRRAEEQWALVNAAAIAELSPDNVLAWFPITLATRFQVWAERGVHVVWSDSAARSYDAWLEIGRAHV